MKIRFLCMAILAGLFLFTSHANAESLIEPDYDGDTPKFTTPWLEYYTPENYKADQDYITMMRPHHGGAIPMSEEYLASPNKQSLRLQGLAKGIIRNQTFEIFMLDTVEKNIQAIDFARDGVGWHKVADQGLAMQERFIRAPMPPIQNALADDVASAEDVKFAKAMIVHHEGALMMAHDYLDNPHSNNGYLERMNLDVLRDQTQEIQLMWNIVNTYPGNHCDIKITPSMIKGMDDMMGHMDFSQVNCTGKSGHKHHMMHGDKTMDCCCKAKGMDCPMDKGGECCCKKKGGMKNEQCAMDFSGNKKPVKNHDSGHHGGGHHGH